MMKEEISKKIKWLLMMDYVNSPRTCEYLGRFCEEIDHGSMVVSFSRHRSTSSGSRRVAWLITQSTDV